MPNFLPTIFTSPRHQATANNRSVPSDAKNPTKKPFLEIIAQLFRTLADFFSRLNCCKSSKSDENENDSTDPMSPFTGQVTSLDEARANIMACSDPEQRERDLEIYSENVNQKRTKRLWTEAEQRKKNIDKEPAHLKNVLLDLTEKEISENPWATHLDLILLRKSRKASISITRNQLIELGTLTDTGTPITEASTPRTVQRSIFTIKNLDDDFFDLSEREQLKTLGEEADSDNFTLREQEILSRIDQNKVDL